MRRCFPVLSAALTAGAILFTARSTLQAESVYLPVPSISGKSIVASGGDGSPVSAKIAPGSQGTPGVILKPQNGIWDFSAHSRIEAVVTNTGSASLPVSLRVDNAGHWKKSPWSTETIRLDPGETKTLVVFFGHSHGWKPAYPLDSSAVVQLLFFTNGAEKERSFSILSLNTEGDPDETPAQWAKRSAIVPVDGILFSGDTPLQSARQLSARGGASARAEQTTLEFKFPDSDSSASFRPPVGSWDLRNFNHLEVTFANQGETEIMLKATADSKHGSTFPGSTTGPVPPGESGIIRIPFASPHAWNVIGGEAPEKQISDRGFVSNAVHSVTLLAAGPGGTFAITEIRATAPPLVLPEWLGKSPPFEGDWQLTFREEFTGPALDDSKWNIYTANHWDKRSHFSKKNVLLEEGRAKLRFEKRKGFHNDDPTEAETDYATGFLDTFGKWKQCYGYFESRMKLPSAPGLWPAFWMMPDRGPDNAPRWKREQTSNGGMEFDIMEHLSGWGPYRYNIAFHWDGYGKNHRKFGTSDHYFQHDKEGFITVGMLWLPGEVTYYCNGKPVGRWQSDRIPSIPSILMFTHVSGGWDNTSLDHAQLPSDFEIDYVRVWQRQDLR